MVFSFELSRLRRNFLTGLTGLTRFSYILYILNILSILSKKWDFLYIQVTVHPKTAFCRRTAIIFG